MDVAARRAFWDQMRTVAATGRTILFATHHLEEAEREAARVIVMDRGRVVADGSGTEIAAVVAARVLTLRGVSAERIAALPGVASAAPEDLDPTTERPTRSDPDAPPHALFTAHPSHVA